MGRLMLACSVLAVLIISSFAVKAIAEPQALKNPALILGYLGAVFLVIAPLGLLGTASVVLRFYNRANEKQAKPPSLPF